MNKLVKDIFFLLVLISIAGTWLLIVLWMQQQGFFNHPDGMW